MESFGAHDCGQCACGSAYHHRSGLYVQLFFEYSHEWFFSDAGACGFGSIRSIIEAVDARKYGYGGWSVGLIFSIISLIFGIICVTNAFDVMKTATVVVGIILIFNGVSNIWITSRATKAESAYNKQKEFEATFVEDRKEDN